MSGSTSRIRTLGAATRRELIRRPGILLTTAGVGSLLLFLPELSANAFDTTGALATELGLSSIALFVSVGAGIAGVQCAAEQGIIGPAAEFRCSPLSMTEYLGGRLLGVAGTILLAGLILVVFAAGGQMASGTAPAHGSAVVAALATTFVQGLLFASVGAFLGSFARPALAVVLLLGCLVASRALLPALATAGDAAVVVGWLLPDPARLDLAHAAAFGRPLAVGSVVAASAAALCQSFALLVLAGALLQRRES